MYLYLALPLIQHMPMLQSYSRTILFIRMVKTNDYYAVFECTIS